MGNYGKQLNYLEEILGIKTPTSREYLIELHHKGAVFREKTVKGKQYLSARMDGKEIGLGLYTQDLRKLISELRKPEQKSNENITDKTRDNLATYTVNVFPSPLLIPVQIEFSRSKVDSALFNIKFERAKVKMIDCEHSFNGFCQYWHFMKNSKCFESIYEEFDILSYSMPKLSNHAQLEVQSRRILRVTELLCFDCEKYHPRKKEKQNK